MPVMAPDIGIDLGTETTSVYVRGRGIVISEPTLVVLERENRKNVRAVGDEASFLYGRSPDQLIAVSPIKNGQVSDFELTELMLRYFLRKAVGVSYLNRPRGIVSVPCSLTVKQDDGTVIFVFLDRIDAYRLFQDIETRFDQSAGNGTCHEIFLFPDEKDRCHFCHLIWIIISFYNAYDNA